MIPKSEQVPKHLMSAHQSADVRGKAVLYLPCEPGIRAFLYMTYAEVKKINCLAWMNLTSLWFSLHRSKPEVTTVTEPSQPARLCELVHYAGTSSWEAGHGATSLVQNCAVPRPGGMSP